MAIGVIIDVICEQNIMIMMGWVVNLFGEYLPNPRGGELHVMMYLSSVCMCMCVAMWHSAELSAKVWQERTYNIVSAVIKLDT